MNTSTQISSASLSVPVKMGSHRMTIDIEASVKCLTCEQFIEIVLRRCRLNGSQNLAKTYAMFESVNGVERLVNASESVPSLCAKWSSTKMPEFVIRKFLPVEKKLASAAISQTSVKKYYKKLRASTSSAKTSVASSEVHVYEQVDAESESSPDVVQLEYLKRVLKNEMKLRRQAKKLLQVEESIHAHVVNLEKNLMETLVKKLADEATASHEATVPVNKPKICAFHKEKIETTLNTKLADNINFLKFLHFKLKSSNKSESHSGMKNSSKLAYKKMDDVLNSSGASDSNSSSQCNSRSTSTSTLESLV